jgi:hypothetical protein
VTLRLNVAGMPVAKLGPAELSKLAATIAKTTQIWAVRKPTVVFKLRIRGTSSG